MRSLAFCALLLLSHFGALDDGSIVRRLLWR